MEFIIELFAPRTAKDQNPLHVTNMGYVSSSFAFWNYSGTDVFHDKIFMVLTPNMCSMFSVIAFFLIFIWKSMQNFTCAPTFSSAFNGAIWNCTRMKKSSSSFTHYSVKLIIIHKLIQLNLSSFWVKTPRTNGIVFFKWENHLIFNDSSNCNLPYSQTSIILIFWTLTFPKDVLKVRLTRSVGNCYDACMTNL